MTDLATSHWWLPAILAMSILVRGELCTDALHCMHHIDGVRTDLEKEDMFSICSKTMMLVTCVEASIKDCHLRNIQIPQQNMVQLSNSILQAKNIYKGYCNGVTPDPSVRRETAGRQTFRAEVPEEATCTSISQCMMDMPAFSNAVANGRSQEACQLISPSVRCLQGAVLDCERSGQMSDDMLNNFKISLGESKASLIEFCHKEDTEMSQSSRGDRGIGHLIKANLLGLITSLILTIVLV